MQLPNELNEVTTLTVIWAAWEVAKFSGLAEAAKEKILGKKSQATEKESDDRERHYHLCELCSSGNARTAAILDSMKEILIEIRTLIRQGITK
jgi:hypothetical protein